jgi:eukaryotic-like serine/threonine-protein kinase
MVGRTVSHYQILEKLGEGGMGVVYKTLDTHLDRFVALKVLPPEKIADADRKRRFVQEARAASALNHPNIVTIYDIGSADGIDFIAMEWVAGKTLDRWIPRNGLRLNEALKYSVQVADALAAAHKAGIVHRDLKPGNLMVTDQGLVKVLDFGLAKLAEPADCGGDDATRTLKPTTEEGTIIGTVSYMSPEQAEGKKLDARSDIFSFGALLYEMVTGRRAFQGDSRLSTLTAILREEPKPAGQVVEGLPRELERIIARCLRKSPERRFQTTADLKVTLEELKEESDSGTLGGVQTRPPRYGRRLAWVFALVAIMTVLVAILWLIRSGKGPEAALNPVPLITYSGLVGEAAFSPDGNQVAFVWNGEKQDNLDIYVKLIGTAGPPLRLTTSAAPDDNPAWSPDGRYIAFLRYLSDGKGAVFLVPALGGPERKVAEVSRGTLRGPSSGYLTSLIGHELTWSADGNSLVVDDRGSSVSEPYALFLISIETGEKHRLTSPPAQVLYGDSGPVFSPDGRTLAFTRIVDGGIRDLYLLAFSDMLKPLGQPTQLVFGNRDVLSPTWSADGREIIFSDGGLLWRVIPSSTGRTAEPQRLNLGEGTDPAISRRGRRLAYTHLFSHSSIGRIALSGANLSEPHNASSAHPLISSTRDDGTPQYLPDGKKISFVSGRSGNPEIWVCDSDGSNAVQLTSFGGPSVDMARWSHDGERLTFDSNASGEWDIYVVSANGGKVQRMTTDPANDGNPSWSRDDRWIYFDSARTGVQQLFKIPANGGEAMQVTRDGGFAPLESADGKFLYYTKGLFGTSLWKIPVEGGQAIKILDGLSTFHNIAVVETGVYFVPMAAHSSLHFFSFATNKISSVATLDKPLTINEGGLAVSPDNRWILYTQFDQVGSELMLVENFR